MNLRKALEKHGWTFNTNLNGFYFNLVHGRMSVHPNLSDVAFVACLDDFDYHLSIFKYDTELLNIWDKRIRYIQDIENEFSSAYQKIIDESQFAFKYGYKQTSIGSYERKFGNDKMVIDRMAWGVGNEKTNFLLRAFIGNKLIRAYFKEDGLEFIIPKFEKLILDKHPSLMFDMNQDLRDAMLSPLLINVKEYEFEEYI